MYRLEKWERVGSRYRHTRTLIWSAPYAICKGQKTKAEAGKRQHEFYKITKV